MTVVPKPIWQGQDCYIIGGGPSLKDFDWTVLRGLNTIGCNDAYLLGEEVCKVMIFGDHKWWKNHKESISKYQGQIYSIATRMNNSLPSNVQCVKRYARGLQNDGIAWNGNTGYAAINLSILFGCTNIYLLGFDMKRTPENSNWHDNNLDKNPDSIYRKFLDWSKYVKKEWEEKYSHINIVNVTDDSALQIFPKVSVNEFWQQRKTA